MANELSSQDEGEMGLEDDGIILVPEGHGRIGLQATVDPDIKFRYEVGGFPSLEWLVTPYKGEEFFEGGADFNPTLHFETWKVAPRTPALS